MESSGLHFLGGHLARRFIATDTASTVATEDLAVERSAFVRAKGAEPDPILSIRDRFLADDSKDKMNVSVGVYRTEEGRPLVLECVKEAEAFILAEQAKGHTNKEYLPPEGLKSFYDASLRLLLGEAATQFDNEGRLVAAQTLSGYAPGARGVRRVGARAPCT